MIDTEEDVAEGVAETDDISADLAAAFEEAEAPEEGAEEGEEGAEEVEEVEAGEGEAEEGAEESGEAEGGVRERDGQGRFKKGAPAVTRPVEGEPKVPDKAQPEAKAPQSWRPKAREAWAKLDPEIRAEVVRRERETSAALQESSSARQWADRFTKTVAPYEMIFRQEGINDPMQAVQGLLNTTAMLRGHDANTKADFIAGLIMRFMPRTGEDGLDGIRMIDGALSKLRGGQGGQPQPGQGQPYRDTRLDDLLQRAQQRQQEQEQAQLRQHQSDLGKFAESHEFFADVREVMAKLLESSLANDYDSAYKQACQMNPEIRAILSQRAAAARARKAGASTQRARAAATSVNSTPVPGKVIKPKKAGEMEEDNIAADIEAAMAQLDG